jgi:hypothetical protein
VSGPTGPYWIGAAVFLVGAVVVALRIRGTAPAAIGVAD